MCTTITAWYAANAGSSQQHGWCPVLLVHSLNNCCHVLRTLTSMRLASKAYLRFHVLDVAVLSDTRNLDLQYLTARPISVDSFCYGYREDLAL